MKKIKVSKKTKESVPRDRLIDDKIAKDSLAGKYND